MEISAICRRDRISKQNEVAIIIRLYHNGIVRKITSGLRIKVDYWDFDNNCLKNGIPNQEHFQKPFVRAIQQNSYLQHVFQRYRLFRHQSIHHPSHLHWE